MPLANFPGPQDFPEAGGHDARAEPCDLAVDQAQLGSPLGSLGRNFGPEAAAVPQLLGQEVESGLQDRPISVEVGVDTPGLASHRHSPSRLEREHIENNIHMSSRRRDFSPAGGCEKRLSALDYGWAGITG